MHKRVQEILDILQLEPHPEGGWFRETFKSSVILQSPQVNAERHAMTDIYFLLEQGQVSRFHRVEHDEIWHFYEGDPIQLVHYDPETMGMHSLEIGNVSHNREQKYVIPSGHWQAARSTGAYSLAGCTVAPGFDFKDFTFLENFTEIQNEILKIDSSLRIFV